MKIRNTLTSILLGITFTAITVPFIANAVIDKWNGIRRDIERAAIYASRPIAAVPEKVGTNLTGYTFIVTANGNRIPFYNDSNSSSSFSLKLDAETRDKITQGDLGRMSTVEYPYQ
jgi:hypothetical protein